MTDDKDGLTKAQRRALVLIVEAGGGSITRYGRLLCAGETGGLEASTWLRLVAKGFVEAENGRLVPTLKGTATTTGSG